MNDPDVLLFLGIAATNLDETAIHGMGTTSQRIQRKPPNINPIANRNLRQSGEAYYDRNGILKEPATFTHMNCKCRNDCSNVPEEERRLLFERFWKLKSWDAQSVYIRMSVKEASITYESQC
jgi:hypothetical protein